VSLVQAQHPVLVRPIRPNAIQPKGPLRIDSMAVRDHVCHPIDCQHQTGRDHAWGRPLPNVFIHNRGGSGLRKRRRDALGPRKDIIVRLPEEVARQLKVVATCEGMTVQDFCEQAIMPQIRKAMDQHGLSAEIARS
jgi:hypothetical protein